jgi:hypothetical protein
MIRIKTSVSFIPKKSLTILKNVGTIIRVYAGFFWCSGVERGRVHGADKQAQLEV